MIFLGLNLHEIPSVHDNRLKKKAAGELFSYTFFQKTLNIQAVYMKCKTKFKKKAL